MGRIEKTVFISYRRTNFPWAYCIYQDLTHHGFDAFLDYQNIDSGNFENVILENIRARAHFVVILAPSALERCSEPGDWFRREIETAIDEKRNIIPIMLESFDFGSSLVKNSLKGKLASLSTYNGMNLIAEYMEAGLEKLRNRFLNVALQDIQLHVLPENIKEITEMQKVVANEAAPVEKSQLTAQEWFERGIVFTQNRNFDEAIQCYTQSILLAPNHPEAYYNRGLVYAKDRGNMDKAISDFDEAIRFNPQDAETHYSRGLAYSAKGDNPNALADFQKASELKAEDGKVQASLIRIHRALGNAKEAKEQEYIARKVIRKEDEYNQACFEAICGNTDRALRFLKVGLKKKPANKEWARRDPDFESLRDDPRFKELVGE